MKMGKYLRIVLAFIIAVSFSVMSKTPVKSAGEGWLPGWNNRIPLTIDRTKVKANFQNFPVLVHISSSSGVNKADISSVFDALKTDDNRFKIAVTEGDGNTQLYVDIETWDTSNKQAWLWVKIPALSSGDDTTLYLYFDSSHPDNREMVGDTGSSPAQKVWEPNFVMVQHMQPDVNISPKTFKDATSRHNNGTEVHGKVNASPQSTRGIIGVSQAFDNSSAIAFPDCDDFSLTTTGELTISLWVSESVPNFKSGGFVNFMGKGSAQEYEWSFVFYQRDWTDRSQRISFYVDNAKGGLGSGSYSQQPIAVNDWVYITARIDGQYTYLYRNGVLAGSDPYKGPDAYVDITPQNCGQPVRIGTRDFGTWFEGRIDEVRMSNTARSAAYIGTSYYSETDNLIAFGNFQKDFPSFIPTPEKSVAAGESISFSISATTRSQKPLTYSAGELPQGASFDAASQTFSWIPRSTQVGTYQVRFTASDGAYETSQVVRFTVNEPPPVQPGNQTPGVPNETINVTPEPPRPPVIIPVGDKLITAGTSISFGISALSPDKKPLTYSTAGLPAGAAFSPSTQIFSWTPQISQYGSYIVHFAVTDGNLTAAIDVTITVIIAESPVQPGSQPGPIEPVGNITSPPVIPPSNQTTVNETKELIIPPKPVDYTWIYLAAALAGTSVAALLITLIIRRRRR